jgi:putative transposase
MCILPTLFAVFRSAFCSRVALELENFALRHQLNVLKRSVPRPRLTPADRYLWVVLSSLWQNWGAALAIVRPETVSCGIARAFACSGPGKCAAANQVDRRSAARSDLIRQMSRDNPLWGAPQIHGELLKLGITIGETTVAKNMVRQRRPPSQTWRTFLNHVKTLVSVDFFTVPTIRFQVLYVFLVLAHERRRVVHFNVTAHPTAEWTAQQLREAIPFEQIPRYLLRDRDKIFGDEFGRQVRDMNIEEVLSTPRSPWQRAYVDRLIGSIRRECLDHVIVGNETSLHRILTAYFSYYHATRPHLSLEKDSPETRKVHPPELGRVLSVPQVGGLHHR